MHKQCKDGSWQLIKLNWNCIDEQEQSNPFKSHIDMTPYSFYKHLPIHHRNQSVFQLIVKHPPTVTGQKSALASRILCEYMTLHFFFCSRWIPYRTPWFPDVGWDYYKCRCSVLILKHYRVLLEGLQTLYLTNLLSCSTATQAASDNTANWLSNFRDNTADWLVNQSQCSWSAIVGFRDNAVDWLVNFWDNAAIWLVNLWLLHSGMHWYNKRRRTILRSYERTE